ncbi:MAG: hypothetical protein JSW25_07510 [Thermoplasmata archaeon]|nr:MAG: hypothetical protein JSW25_07510 [Thermoplasmata archaeon]
MLCLVVVTMMVTGCLSSDDDDDDEPVKPGDTLTETKDIELGSASVVEVYLEQGSGDFQLAPGATKLMEAEFVFNIERWRPTVTYKEEGQVWNLSVIQPEQDLRVEGNVRNEWDIMLGTDVPKELTVLLGAGDADVAASGLNITKLHINVGAGQLDLDLTGIWEEDLTAKLLAGTGDVQIRVPAGVGVKLTAILGVGDVTANGFTKSGNVYTNGVYGTAPITITIEANAGVGNIVVTEI